MESNPRAGSAVLNTGRSGAVYGESPILTEEAEGGMSRSDDHAVTIEQPSSSQQQIKK